MWITKEEAWAWQLNNCEVSEVTEVTAEECQKAMILLKSTKTAEYAEKFLNQTFLDSEDRFKLGRWVFHLRSLARYSENPSW